MTGLMQHISCLRLRVLHVIRLPIPESPPAGRAWFVVRFRSLMPIGAPFVMLPMMAGLLKGGAGMGAVVTLLTATALLGPSRIFVYEIPIMGGGFFLVRFASVFWVPPVTGVIAHFVSTRFSAG